MSELANMAQQFSGLPMESLIGGPLMAAAEANARMAASQVDFIMKAGFNTKETSSYGWFYKDSKWEYRNEKTKQYDPIMITLEMVRPALDENGNQLMVMEEKDVEEVVEGKTIKVKKLVATDKVVPPAVFQIKVPLLSIIPINSLAVTSVDIHFEMEVKSSSEESAKESSKSSSTHEASLEASAGWGWGKVSIKGSASYTSEDAKERNTHYQKSNNAKYVVDVKAGQLPLPQGITTILDIYAKNIIPANVSPKEAAPAIPA